MQAVSGLGAGKENLLSGLADHFGRTDMGVTSGQHHFSVQFIFSLCVASHWNGGWGSELPSPKRPSYELKLGTHNNEGAE